MRERRGTREEPFRRLSTSLPQIVGTAAPAGGVTYFNEQWYEYTGRAREDSLGAAWVGALHPDDVAGPGARSEQARTSGMPYEVEYRCRRADGVFRWQLARGL